MNKKETVIHINKIASTLAVKNITDKALRGEVSLDRALVVSRESTNQFQVRSTANKALGFDPHD